MTKTFKKIVLCGITLICLEGLFFACLTYNKQAKLLALSQEENQSFEENSLLTIQKNSILPVSSLPEAKIVRRIKVITTAYSSSPLETDDTPFVTAAGTPVRDGVVANNLLAFGTKIRLPEIYGDKVFVVEDRMHWSKGYYHIDIWFPSYYDAVNFGAKMTYIEVLES